MYAIRYHETGYPEVLCWEEVDVSEPGTGEVLLKNTAIGVGLKETGERKGTYPCPPLPAIPGITAAAEILETGAEVTDFEAGDRIAYAGMPAGSYCEQRVMPADRLVALPDDIDDQTAAALFHKGMTARFLLRKTYSIRAGDTVLVHAAAGGVGLILCQWAKHLGATVIGTVSTDVKAEVAAAGGCDYPIVYSRDDFAEKVRDLTGGVGVPVVYDSVGKDTFSKSLECLQPTGLMVLYGIASGHPPPLELMKQDISTAYYFTRPSFYVHTKTRKDLLECAGDLFEVVQSGAVKATISEKYPLKDAAEAHRALESRRSTGSVILIP